MNLKSGFVAPKEKKEEDVNWPYLLALYAGILRDETFSWRLPECNPNRTFGLNQEDPQAFKPTDLVGLNSKEHNGITFMQNHTEHTVADAGRQTLQKISNSRASENYRPSYNLNLSSRSGDGESSSAAMLFKLDPITPDRQTELKINQINHGPHSLLGAILTQERDRQDNNDLPNQPEIVARERTSSARFSTTPKENQNSDGGQGGVGLNDTPPQKTPKRKKHQPKVAVERISKRTPESAANKNNNPDGNPPPEKKYARKTNTKSSPNQSTKVATGVEASGVDSKAKSCKRALNFNVEDNGAEKKSKGREFDSANKVQHSESWPLAATRSEEDTNGVGIVGEEWSSIVPYKKIAPTKKSQAQSKVNIDPETSRLWNLLMSKDGSQSAEVMDKDKQKYWDEERELFRSRVDSFVARMHLVQGDKRFSKWKGSVVDSVVGVFLTQNVSDYLSSSAFMSLAAKFPIKSKPVIVECSLNRGRTSLEHGLTVSYPAETTSDHRMKRNTVYSQSCMESSRQNQASEDIGSSLGSNSEAKDQISRSNFGKHHDHSKLFQEMGSSLPDNRKRKAGKEKAEFHWDSLRKQAQPKPEPRGRNRDVMDSIDYEALLDANVGEISEAIKERGMNKMLAERIKDFLSRLVRDHERIDLEWLRDVQQDKARDYLLSIQGLGPKSVDCVRLLTLHHLAFPVDTNVGRIAVRLGWVPLKPHPEALHLVEEYPVLATVQKYLWPRLCKLDHETLYELHYQMITFGKVFCTKKEPNCNACPMKEDCRHYTSASESSRLALPGPGERHKNSSADASTSSNRSAMDIRPMPLHIPQTNLGRGGGFSLNCELEEPTTPESPVEVMERDIEDAFHEDPDEITAIPLDIEEFTTNFLSIIQEQTEMQGGDISKAVVTLNPEIASIPKPTLKHASRLRTEHQVYELPDSHPLLQGLEKREADDPSPYLFALWTPGETADLVQAPESKCNSSRDGLCDKKTFVSCNSIGEGPAQTVRGTILIPCRTAMRGSFPLNGTYFQVNEVFADHETSMNPVNVSRGLIWNLPRRTVFCGTSVSTILKGLSAERIKFCFWQGFVCVRGFEPKSRAPRPLHQIFHRQAGKVAKENE